MKPTKFEKALQKEWQYIEAKERRLCERAKSKEMWKNSIEEKVPQKAQATLEGAFKKAFELVFDKGVGVIEKTYNLQELMTDYEAHDSVVNIKRNRRELKKMRKISTSSGLLNLAVTTIEGVGLGVLGIGLPDIVAFIGMLIRGAFELSVQYGYDYNLPCEKYFILKMMEGALAKDEEWERIGKEIDEFIKCPMAVSDGEVEAQMKRTAEAMALEMVILKFIQGMPLIGVLGGISNPVYYNKVMNYVRLKYYKRYLTEKMAE